MASLPMYCNLSGPSGKAGHDLRPSDVSPNWPPSQKQIPVASDYLTFLASYSKQHEDQQHSPDSAGKEGGETRRGAKIKRQAASGLANLGTDLLQQVFKHLGPHPKNLVPVGAVCREWRDTLKDVTWKELCLEHAGGLVNELGLKGGRKMPPGGWGALYKMLVYCPGLHFPTFDGVLSSDALESGVYRWEEGLGHLDNELKCFFKGSQVHEALCLAPQFSKDVLYVSSVCVHSEAFDNDSETLPPGLSACRGIVKKFRTSALARSVGAVAAMRKAGGSISKACKEETLLCPYCNAQTFALTKEHFPDAYRKHYDELFRENNCSDEEADEDVERGIRRLMTGSVCLYGHLVLGMGGWEPDLDEEAEAVPDSGEGLTLPKCDAVKYFTKCMDGVRSDLNFEEGQRFVDGLTLDQMITVGGRLAKLYSAWPIDQYTDGCLPTARDMGFQETPLVWLNWALPQSVLDCLHKHVLRGEPSLPECASQLEELYESEEKRRQQERRQEHIDKELLRAGYQLRQLPHPKSRLTYIEHPDAITEVEVLAHQKRVAAETSESEKSGKCLGTEVD